MQQDKGWESWESHLEDQSSYDFDQMGAHADSETSVAILAVNKNLIRLCHILEERLPGTTSAVTLGDIKGGTHVDVLTTKVAEMEVENENLRAALAQHEQSN